MNLEIIILTILTVAAAVGAGLTLASVLGSGLTLFEIKRRVKYRNSQNEYEKAINNHPAGKGLRSEEDILNGR